MHQRALLEQFFETKKTEFTEYIDKVTRAFADKDETERSLRDQIAALRADVEARARELEAVRDDLRGDLAPA